MSYRGNVQGVGFRATAKAAARGWPVSGWVRNEGDGTVTLEVQGERTAVDGMLADLRRRMAGHIRNETAMVIGPEDGEEEFRIER